MLDFFVGTVREISGSTVGALPPFLGVEIDCNLSFLLQFPHQIRPPEMMPPLGRRKEKRKVKVGGGGGSKKEGKFFMFRHLNGN